MAKKAISYGRQTIDDSDISAVVEALRSAAITQGPLVEEFERRLAAFTGARYAVACSSGTAALHMACLAAGLGPGSKAVTSPITFLASANAPLYAGATPDFADIDERTCNIDPAEVERKAASDGTVKALIPVHFAGLPCRMEEIGAVAARHGLVVIEDACHALGAEWTDSSGATRKVGSCSHSDMTVFSFHPVKSITTAEGGAITTNSEQLWLRLKALRSHGVTKDPALLVSAEPAPWYYEMQQLGFNYRLSDLQCALGISQLGRIGSFMDERARVAGIYDRDLSKYPFLELPARPAGARSAHHLYPVRIAFEELGTPRRELFRLMAETGINLQVHYIPVHLQPFYAGLGFKAGDFPRAERFYEEEVSLPIYPLLVDEEAGAVAEGLISALACGAAPPIRAWAV